MNILLLNHYAGAPQYGMEYRPYYLGREWCRRGHQVSIVAASWSHLRSRAPTVERSVVEEVIDGIRYVWLRTPGYHGNGLGRVANMLTFLLKLELGKRRIVGPHRPDVVIASSTYPLDNVPARHLARPSRAAVVYEVHDLWPLSPMELGHMSRWHPFIIAMQWAENYACRGADRVVSLLPKAEPHLREHGMPAGRFTYIPNGIDVEEWSSQNAPIPQEHRQALAALRRTGGFLIGYAGAHGVANALHTVVEAARLLRDSAVCFVLVGQGPEKEVLQKHASEYGLRNLLFLPAVPKASVPSLLESLDALYIGLQRQPLFRFGVSPNKLMDYMMSGKPVIQAIAAGNDFTAESRCGISIPPEDPEALAGAARQLMSWTPAQREEAGKRGHDHVVNHHDYRALARQFLDVLQDAVQSLGKPAPAGAVRPGGVDR